MNLRNKKQLAAKALKVGKGRVIFDSQHLEEIKKAITKQDIINLKQEGIISIRPVKGRRTIVKRKTRKGPGKIKMTVKNRKQDYVKITRKLRRYVKELRSKGLIDRELYLELRKKIKMKNFKSLANLKENLKEIEENIKKTGKSGKKKVDKDINSSERDFIDERGSRTRREKKSRLSDESKSSQASEERRSKSKKLGDTNKNIKKTKKKSGGKDDEKE